MGSGWSKDLKIAHEFTIEGSDARLTFHADQGPESDVLVEYMLSLESHPKRVRLTRGLDEAITSVSTDR
jgi:hypothetical protein